MGTLTQPTPRIILSIYSSLRIFLDPRGHLGTPLSVRASVPGRQKSGSTYHLRCDSLCYGASICQSLLNCCGAVATLRAEQGSCMPSKGFVSKSREREREPDIIRESQTECQREPDIVRESQRELERSSFN